LFQKDGTPYSSKYVCGIRRIQLKTKCFITILVLLVTLSMVGCLPSEQVAMDDGAARISVERIAEDVNAEKSFPAEVPAATKSASPIKSLWNDIWTLPDVVITETPEVAMKPGNTFLLLAAGAGSIAMHNSGADSRIANNFANSGNLNRDVDKIGDYMGGPGQHFAASGLWYLLAAGSGDELNKDRSWTMIKALSVTGATTFGLKLIRNNNCPNGKSLAWPSGHTSSSFTVAAVLDEFY
jgi:hypothetical protein